MLSSARPGVAMHGARHVVPDGPFGPALTRTALRARCTPKATITMHGARRVVPKAGLRPEERLKMEINKKTST